jgi:Dickkopf N-terminal cysteine-rich region
VLTTPGSCIGTGTCNGGGTGPCLGGFVCTSPPPATTCKTSCATDADCEGTNVYCSSGACVSAGGTGDPCSEDDQCVSNVCGTKSTGGIGTHCCAAACTLSGACGNNDCNGSGACVLADNTIACTASTCSGDTQTNYTTCNGAGACLGTNTPMTCGRFACGATTCDTACGTDDATGDAKCQSGSWCDGVAGGACQAPQAAPLACNRNNQCSSGNCCLVAGTPAACVAGKVGQCL